MAKDLAVILNNGSINSAVVTAMAAQKYRPIMVFAETSANVASRAKAAYEQQVSHFKPYREHTIPLPFLSVLQPPGEAQAAAADPRHSAMLPSQLIRLLPLVSSAAAFAAHYQAAAVYVGLRIGPNPDDLARATEYFQIFNELLQIPCAQGETEIIAPLLELEAWQVIDVGYQVGAPLDRAWSCLEDGADACWNCAGCRQRDAAFQQAGKPDPLRAPKK